jgi:Zn-dependent peptidase ImmA (M78 family)
VSAAPLHPGEKLARATLRRYGLTSNQPMADLLGTIEGQARVPVLLDRFNDAEIAGVLLRQAGGESFIAVNADHLPVRQRFTLAHEWGHIEAGHTPRLELTAELFGSPSQDPQEVEANYFAAELLAPREAVEQWFIEHNLDGDVDGAAVAQMAMQFGIAFPTACYRLERAGVINPGHKKKLVATLKAEGRSYARRFESGQLQDALDTTWDAGAYPRTPQITSDYAAQALEANLVDQEEYEEIIGTQDRLDAWLQ